MSKEHYHACLLLFQRGKLVHSLQISTRRFFNGLLFKEFNH